MGWFGKPETKIVISLTSNIYLEQILNLLVPKDTVIMVFGANTSVVKTIPQHLQQYVLIWESAERLNEGLKFSNIFISDVKDHPYKELSDQYFHFKDLINFKRNIVETIPLRYEHDFNYS
jgi:hypothetical protein